MEGVDICSLTIISIFMSWVYLRTLIPLFPVLSNSCATFFKSSIAFSSCSTTENRAHHRWSPRFQWVKKLVLFLGRLVTSVACDLFIISMLLSVAIFWVISTTSQTRGRDKEWGFGQVIPLVLLAVPILSAPDAFFGQLPTDASDDD